MASKKKYGAKAHSKEVLRCFPTRLEACIEEAKLVTAETLADPLCLNLILGGGNAWIPEGTTTNKIVVNHPEMKKQIFISPEQLPQFSEKGWARGRTRECIEKSTGNWYQLEDGSYTRSVVIPSATAIRKKRPSTPGYTWVQRDGKQCLVAEVLETDKREFNQKSTNLGKKRLVDTGGVERMVDQKEIQELLKQGWKRPTPPMAGRIGMRSPDKVKKFVFEPEADALWELGWRLVAKQLKSAPPQVLAFAAKHGMKLPVKRKR